MNKNMRLKLIAQKYEAIEDYVSQYVFPIFVCYTDKKFELFGSCVGVNIGNRKYICTASHVLENAQKTNTTIVAGMAREFVELKLDDAMYFMDEKIDYDMCLVPCASAPDEVNFFRDSDFSKNEIFETGECHYLQGYPISKNKSFDIHDHENLKIRTGYLKVMVKIEQNINHEIKGVSNATHLTFRYDEIDYQKGKGEFSSVKGNSSPKLVGLSGCGIWKINNINDPSATQLAGIFTTLSKTVGVGTKINSIVNVVQIQT